MGTAAPPTTPVSANDAPRHKPWWRKALFGLATVALVLALLEAALWAMGAPRGTDGPDPFVGFSSAHPHFEVVDGTARRPEARATIMNPFEFVAEKPERTLRVICVGGSTTYGRPHFDATSFAGYLRAMLPAAAEGRDVDVINAGAISYASYRVTSVMREAARFEPDVFVIYTGQNEFLEHRTYEDIRSIPSWLRTASSVASATRTGTLLARTFTTATGGPSGLDEGVTRIPTNAIGPDAFHRDDGWRAQVVSEFRRALHGMVDVAERAGARAVLVVPASNVADWGPWGSQASDALAVGDVGRFLARIQTARSAAAAGDAAGAEAAARECVELDARHAESWFVLGQALQSLGRTQEAASALQRALEEDVVPLRAVAALRDAVREVGAERNAMVVDLGALLAGYGNSGVPGDESFSDHVHPWPAVNLRLAEAIFDALAADGLVKDSADARIAAAAAGAKLAVLQNADPAHRSERARELLRLAYVLVSFDRTAQARDRCELAVELMGGGGDALAAAALSLDSAGDAEGALILAMRAVEEDPESPAAHTRLAAALLATAPVRAREHLERAIALDANTVEAHARLGALLADDGSLGAAEVHFRDVVRLRPDKADSHYNLGLLLVRRGQRDEAAAALREAIRIDPGHADAKKQLEPLLR